MTDIQEKIRKAEQARARATDRLARLKTAARAADRRADAHRKIELGGLVIAAGADVWDPAEICGGLLELRDLASADERARWRERGITHLEARKLSRQSGVSLLSIIITTTLLAGVVAAGWTVMQRASTSADVVAARQQAVALSHRIPAAWAASSDFATLSTQAAQARGVFQRADLDADGNPADPWGGGIVLSPLGQGFSIIFGKVPTSDCTALVAAAAPAGFEAISVEVGTSWQQVATHGQADLAAAAQACKLAGDPASVQFVVFPTRMRVFPWAVQTELRSSRRAVRAECRPCRQQRNGRWC